MKTVAIIPARYASSRFPGKPLADICGKPMIQHVYESACLCRDLDMVCVATDDSRIYDCVKGFGGNVMMTSPYHSCGTERVAECADILGLADDDIVINIQGDEPLIHNEMIQQLVSLFPDRSVNMATLRRRIDRAEEKDNPNVVKVVTDVNGDAVYFSRFCLPFERGGAVEHYKHIGIYGYRKWFLMKFCSLPKGKLEMSESLEQLRSLENGYKIRVGQTDYDTCGVDTPDQIEKVKSILCSK